MKLTEKENQMIKMALQYVYDRKLEQLRRDHKIIGESERAAILEVANGFWDLSEKFK